MTNRQIARTFNKLAKVMELHGENPFKIRSYSSAYNTIRRMPDEAFDLTREQLMEIGGIGKNIADKIEELKAEGQISTLERYLDKTPKGIVELLNIKGFGAKKILTVWKELGIESPGELLYACQENRLVDLKGFGAKTQENLIKQLIYFLDAQGKYLYGHVLEEAEELLYHMKEQYPYDQFDFINDIKRQNPIVHSIEIIGTAEEEELLTWLANLEGIAGEENEQEQGTYEQAEMAFRGTSISYQAVDQSSFHLAIFEQSGSEDFMNAWYEQFGEEGMDQEEEELFDLKSIEFIPAECRESIVAIEKAKKYELDIIEEEAIKGVVHAHSTYSDGVNTLAQMAQACQSGNFEYLVISDHSQSAFYANGLKPDRVIQQMQEIDRLNQSTPDFKIFKGIESDILYDGRLDYDEEILSQFDVVIASVHANLKMDIVKATDRLITAIGNKYTRILGHPTGRLLLSREGYPIDHKAAIEACAANNVIIELNANPYRLDLDWTWIPYAIEKGVKISINPDAHSVKGIGDITYGVSAARKALVRPVDCINTLNLEKFTQWVHNK